MTLVEILSRSDLPEQKPVTATIFFSLGFGTIRLPNARYCTDGQFPHWHGTLYDGQTVLVMHTPDVKAVLDK